jgi:hypothetical protein
LLGFVDARYAAFESTRETTEQHEYDTVVERLERELGSFGLNDSLRSGRSFTEDEAIREALEIERRSDQRPSTRSRRCRSWHQMRLRVCAGYQMRIGAVVAVRRGRCPAASAIRGHSSAGLDPCGIKDASTTGGFGAAGTTGASAQSRRTARSAIV